MIYHKIEVIIVIYMLHLIYVLISAEKGGGP